MLASYHCPQNDDCSHPALPRDGDQHRAEQRESADNAATVRAAPVRGQRHAKDDEPGAGQHEREAQGQRQRPPRTRKARAGRSPVNGKEIKISAKTLPAFAAGQGFKQAVDKTS